MKSKWYFAFCLLVSLLLTACDAETTTTQLVLKSPARQTQAVNYANIYAELRINNAAMQTVEFNSDSNKAVNVSGMRMDTQNDISVSWYASVNGQPLLIATQVGNFTPDSSTNSTSISIPYDFNHNDDNDGKNNFQELNDGTCPFASCGDGPLRLSGGLTVYGLNGADPAQTFVPWLASVYTYRHNSVSDSGSIALNTMKYGDTFSIQDSIDFRLGQYPIDTCKIQDDSGSSSSGSSGSAGTGGGPPYVKAGSSVVINSPSGPWLRIEAGENLRYESDRPGPLPVGATLSIPGDVFPSVGAYPLSEPSPPQRISPAGDALFDVNTTYAWRAGNDNTKVAVEFLEYDASGFVGFIAICYTDDDGNFELPVEVAAVLDASANSIYTRYFRYSRRIDLIDGVVFYQRAGAADI